MPHAVARPSAIVRPLTVCNAAAGLDMGFDEVGAVEG